MSLFRVVAVLAGRNNSLDKKRVTSGKMPHYLIDIHKVNARLADVGLT